MRTVFVIWHDNGSNKELEGYTEYLDTEIAKEGGIFALLADYRKCGMYVYRYSIITLTNEQFNEYYK